MLKDAYATDENPPTEIISSFKNFWQSDEDVLIFCNDTWRIVDYICIYLYVIFVQDDVTDTDDIEAIFGGSGSVHYWKLWTSLFNIKWFKRNSADLRADDSQRAFRNFFRGMTDTVNNIRKFISIEYSDLDEVSKAEVKQRVIQIL